jgi:hypothetical protein
LISSVSRAVRFEVRSRHRWPTDSEQSYSDSGPFASSHSPSLAKSRSEAPLAPLRDVPIVRDGLRGTSGPAPGYLTAST